MTRKDSEFRHQSLQDPSSLFDYLTALTEGFTKGSLQFRDDSGDITLEPAGLIRFDISAARKSDQQSLTLKFSWRQPDEEDRDAGPLLINGTTD